MSRAIQVSWVKKSRAQPDTDGRLPENGGSVDADQVSRIVETQVHTIAMTVTTVILVKKAADTVSELILMAGRKYI